VSDLLKRWYAARSAHDVDAISALMTDIASDTPP
jgi:hypothetical protein